MMKSDYDVAQAPEETKAAMRDRCETNGHDWDNCCSAIFQIYQTCRWCGAVR